MVFATTSKQAGPQWRCVAFSSTTGLWKQLPKIALFAKFLKLPILSSSSFVKIQRTYVTPSIEEIWTNHQNETFEEFRGKDIVVLG